MPITLAIVAETYTEEILFPWVKGAARPGSAFEDKYRYGIKNTPGANAFWFQLNSNKGPLLSGRQSITSVVCAKEGLADQPDPATKGSKEGSAVLKNASPYPNACRYMATKTKNGHATASGSWDQAPNDAKEYHASCCPFRHLYTVAEPVDAQQLRGTAMLDFQIGESMGNLKKNPGLATGMYTACLVAQGSFTTTFWYKTADRKAECRPVLQ